MSRRSRGIRSNCTCLGCIQLQEYDRKVTAREQGISEEDVPPLTIVNCSCNCSTEPRLRSRRARNADNAAKESGKLTEWVTYNDRDTYDIDTILRELGEEPTTAKKKEHKNAKKSKQKAKKAKKKESDSNEDKKPNEPIKSDTEDCEESKDEVSSEITDEVPKDSRTNDDCSICFGTRIHTFVFVPCGHATFCEDCATRIFNEVKKCPTCQALITHSVRLYL